MSNEVPRDAKQQPEVPCFGTSRDLSYMRLLYIYN